MAALEVLGALDFSLSNKMGVHATLCGGAICKLGTDVQKRQKQQVTRVARVSSAES